MTDRARLWELLRTKRRSLDQTRVMSTRDVAGGTLQSLEFTTSAGDRLRGYYLKPDKPSPGLLYCHAHGGRYDIGIEELVDGRPALTKPYLDDLTGFAVLSIEMPCFGSRASVTESAASKAHLWYGTTLFGQMISELLAGLDWLADQPKVDATRLGTMGISMGGTHAMWLAALEPRLRAAVTMCSFADLARLIETGAHDGHNHYMTVPGLCAEFTTGRLAGLAAPCAQLHCVGLEDAFTPPDAFERAHDELTAVYGEEKSQLSFHAAKTVSHFETEAMRNEVLSFLHNRLLDVS